MPPVLGPQSFLVAIKSVENNSNAFVQIIGSIRDIIAIKERIRPGFFIISNTP